MVENVFIRRWMVLFARALEETDLNYLSHLSCLHPQSSMEHLTNTELADMYMVYGLAEGNARAVDRLYLERYPHRDASGR
ncbi:hypothetical protein TNCV_3129181 [Trichonephila clavipes]|nr:hypothetical protein TNCV_3129181 [Trichonephila clavipes]